MKSQFRPTDPGDEDRLRTLLAASFGVSPDLTFLRSDVMNWKYWLPRDDYHEPRSFVLEKDGKLLAHAGIWPLRMRSQSETAAGCHMIDWASDPSSPGSGVALVQRLTGMFDFIYAIGGSAMTQKVLPAFGFKRAGEVWSAARPVRPLRQVLTHQHRNWKLPVRLLRNAFWAFWPVNASTPGAEQWTLTESQFVPLQTSNTSAMAERTEGFFRYLEQCPALKISLLRIGRGSEIQGYVVLGFAGPQLRIGGILMRDASEQNLRAAHALIQKTAKQNAAICEVDAMGSTDESARAAVRSGFRMSGLTPVFLYRRKNGPSIYPTTFEMYDYDALSRPYSGPAYWT